MRLALIALFCVLPLAGAQFNFEIRADNGTVLGSGSITTTNDVLQRIEDWRLEQTVPDPDNPGQTILKYPTRASLFKAVNRDFFKTILGRKPTAAIQVELDKMSAAVRAIAELKDAAAQ